MQHFVYTYAMKIFKIEQKLRNIVHMSMDTKVRTWAHKHGSRTRGGKP
jgi:hypothetical protein